MRLYSFGLLIAAVLCVGLSFPAENVAADDAEEIEDGKYACLSHFQLCVFKRRRLNGDSTHTGLTGERLLNHILDEVDKGHVTRDRISRWLTQIRQGVEDGSLTQAQVDSFMETMKTKLRTNSDSGTCCPFG